MGLADDLGYRFPAPGPARRAVQRLASTVPGARLLARILPPLDTLTQRLTGDRHALAELLGGLPVVDVTTRGRRTGILRTTHLTAIPHDGTLALLGTNFGGSSTPAWVHNLEADPSATIAYRGRSIEVRARPAGPAELETILERVEPLYGGYRKYRQRITGRRLRAFVLEPDDPGARGQAAPAT